MANKKASIPFLAVLVAGLCALLVLVSIFNKQLKEITKTSVKLPGQESTSTPLASPIAANHNEATPKPTLQKPNYKAGWKEYHNNAFNYSVAYPSDQNITKEQTYTLIDGVVRADFYVTGTDVFGSIEPFEKSLEDTKNEIIKTMANIPAKLTVKSVSKTEIGAEKYDATKIIFTYNRSDSDDIVVFLVTHDEMTYTLTWHGYNGNRPFSYENSGQHIFDTFRFTD